MSDDDIDNMDFDLPMVPPENNPMRELLEMDMKSMEPKPQYEPNFSYTTTEDFSRYYHLTSWICIYPVYINSEKTLQQGRKLEKTLAVKEPVAIYMAESAKTLGLQVVLESKKRHPRDFFTFGRIRVKLTDEKGSFVSSIKTKKQLMMEIAKNMTKCGETLEALDPKMKGYAETSRSVVQLKNE